MAFSISACAISICGGGFGSALDADTSDGEGALYRWTSAETAKVLGDGSALFDYAYGIEQTSGVPWRAHSDDETAKHFNLAVTQPGCGTVAAWPMMLPRFILKTAVETPPE